MNNKKTFSNTFDCKHIPVSVNFSCFQGISGVSEYHITMFPVEYSSVSEQLEWLNKSYRKTLEYLNLSQKTSVFRRFFFSDIRNQYNNIKVFPFADPEKYERKCAISIVSQPPYPPAKVCLWSYHIADKKPLKKIKNNSSIGICRGKLTHFWDTNITCIEPKSTNFQTTFILNKYNLCLKKKGMKMAENVIRTWFFIESIDSNYKEFVEARRKFFQKHGLTPETHFIASTGIEGHLVNVNSKVSMDAYSISGIQPQQIEFLRAPEHISPTHIYGVTFERGTVVNYNDRRHVFISGTASIDSNGEIVYPGNMLKQFEHTLENIKVLLNRAHAGFEDVYIFVVYIRDASDMHIVYSEMKKRFEKIPFVVCLSSVCRPGWLVEIECQAICAGNNPNLPEF